MAQHAQILVRKQRGKWSVKGADLDQTFSDQLAAIKAGIDWANKSGKNGRPVMVLCESGKRRFKTVWTYGVDDYPPTESRLLEICVDASTTAAR